MVVAGFELVGQNRRRISIKIESVSLSYVVFSCFIPPIVRNNAMNFFKDLPANRRVAWPVSIIEVKFERIFSDLFCSISLSSFYSMTVVGGYS